ncbi:MAG: NAD regulator [Pseudomonadota bacterium]
MLTTAEGGAEPRVVISLSAVVVAIDEDKPLVMTVRQTGGPDALPYGPFDPADHRTFELGVRDFVERQTGLALGYVEQLYTFGDRGREAPSARLHGGAAEDRVVSVGYLALVRRADDLSAAGAAWRNWYGFFPWEDWRKGEPAAIAEALLPGLVAWRDRAASAHEGADRTRRIRVAFGLDDGGWREERTLDRYELMYEAGLAPEAARDRAAAGLPAPRGKAAPPGLGGLELASDHRRILATAMSRLRGKVKYRPIIFDACEERFTLTDLQRAVEAVCGFALHKPNFRRMALASGLVSDTGDTRAQTGGRPAALFTFQSEARGAVPPALGLAVPRLGVSPEAGGLKLS